MVMSGRQRVHTQEAVPDYNNSSGGYRSHRLSIVTAVTARSKLFDQLFSAFWPLTTRIFRLWPLTVLNFNCWPLTKCKFTEVYGRMSSDSTPSLVYGLTSAVTAVTIESMGAPPVLVLHRTVQGIWMMNGIDAVLLTLWSLALRLILQGFEILRWALPPCVHPLSTW